LRQHGSSQDGLGAVRDISQKKVIFNREPTKYDNFLIGFNSRLDEIQAAILLVKLKYIDKWNKNRIQNALRYNKAWANVKGIVIPDLDKDSSHIFHLYILLSDERDKLIAKLESKGIQTGIYYPVPLHLQPALEYLGYKEGDFPVAEHVCRCNFAIPVFPELTKREIKYIVNTVKLSLK
jgi:hypothetical protein